MNDEIKNSILFQLLKLLGAFIISWLFAVIVFSTVVPAAEDGALPEKYNLPIFGIAVILAVVVNMIIDYNSIQNLKSLILKSKASYPELKANINTQKLLNQLESTENAKLSARTIYSSAVAKYNAKIHSFPAVLLRNTCKWDDVTIADNFSKDELVTDEELGI